MTDELPRQISASPRSAYYDPYWSRLVEIHLDGTPVKFAVTADANEGWIDVFETDAEGKFIPDGNGEVKVKRLHGKVEIFKVRGAE